MNLVKIDFLFGIFWGKLKPTLPPYHETNCNKKTEKLVVQKAFAFSSWGLKDSFFGHFGGNSPDPKPPVGAWVGGVHQ